MFLADDPIVSEDDDALGRMPFVRQLASAIESWRESKALIIGLNAKWGEGKSSVLNLLGAELRQREDLVLIEFNPWSFNSEEQLIQGFLTALENGLTSSLGATALKAAGSLFGKLRRSLSSIDFAIPFTGAGVSFDLTPFTRPDESIDELIRQVQRLVEGSSKRVVILMDDLDRLHPDELITSLKLVRFWALFRYVSYVIAMDRTAISGTLKQANNDPSLIDKVINVELRLPKIEPAAIAQLVDKGMSDILQAHGLDVDRESRQRYADAYQRSLAKRVLTLRDAKRWINAVHFSLSLVPQEVNFVDFALVEAIRLHFPLEYDSIRSSKELLAAFDYLVMGGSTDRARAARQEFHRRLADGLEQEDAALFNALLGNLFPLVSASLSAPNTHYTGDSWDLAWQRSQRICHPAYFDRYFVLSLPSSEIPDAVVRAFIKMVNEAHADRLPEIVKAETEGRAAAGALLSLLNKLIVFEDQIATERRVRLAICLASSSIHYRHDRGAFMQGEADRAVTLIYVLLSHIEDGEELNRAIREVLEATTTAAFGATFAFFLQPERNGVFRDRSGLIDYDALRQQLREILRDRFSRRRDDVFQTDSGAEGHILHQWGDFAQDRDGVTEYVFGMSETDHGFIGRVLTLWERGKPGDHFYSFDYADLAAVMDVEKIYPLVTRLRDEQGDDVLSAVERFIAGYEQRNT